jgi:aspartokinase/homoserine dehydrogenase 1
LKNAEQLGLTKSDSRQDLSGIEDAKKLLILVREIGKDFELNDVAISSLLLPNLNQLVSKFEYASNKELLDKPFHIAKIAQAENHVLRYVGEYSALNEKLEVKLVSEPLTSSIGQLKGLDTVFEIYTQSYGKIPIVIHGASVEKKVVACGVLTDILKVAEKIKIRERILA